MLRARFSIRALALGAAVLAFMTVGVPQSSATLRDDADWSEAYFPSGDGITQLHADILRPKGLPLDAAHKTPVILSVSPYMNHSGQVGVAGPLAGTWYDPTATGPNGRFYDFLDLSHILSGGYTYVTVDLPGFGGSGGCNDWGGAREQGAVKAAVEWAASQPWSTGKVGMIGKSYDGWTGLMGIAQHPPGLAAVVSLEPVYSGYGYEYMNGVRMSTSLLEGGLFAAIDATPGTVNDSPQYNANGAPEVWCYGVNVALQQQDDPDTAFWTERNLLLTAKGSTIPLFLTQGFLEDNTKPDQAFDFFNGMAGPKRAWFGQWDHCRAWETYGSCKGTDSTRLAVGRAGFTDEVVRFFDAYLKGGKAALKAEGRDPAIEVQDNLGRFRAEKSWPPADSTLYWSDLKPGTYADDGRNEASGQNGGHGIWTFSQPLARDVWLAGEPVVNVTLSTVAPRANLVANVYDVAPDGRATLVSRGTMLLRGVGEQNVSLKLYGEDWAVPARHRLGVLLSGANSEWWVHVPTNTDVTVSKASVGLPFLRRARSAFLDGGSTVQLEDWLADQYVTVSAETIQGGEGTFQVP